jgi:hypothetical protein
MEGSICKAQIEFIHSLRGICIVQLKLLTKDQMALFLRRDSKGPGAVSTYPCVRKIKGGKFEATYRENWKRRRYTHAMQYASMNLSFTTCYTRLISPIDIAVDDHECRELLLVDSCNLHCAMVINLVQLNA